MAQMNTFQRRRIAKRLLAGETRLGKHRRIGESLVMEGIRFKTENPNASNDEIADHLHQYGTRCGFVMWITIAGMILQIVVPIIIKWWQERQAEKEEEETEVKPTPTPEPTDDNDIWTD